MRARRPSAFAFANVFASRSDAIGLRLAASGEWRKLHLTTQPRCYICSMYKLLLAILPALILLAVACSGDDDPPSATPTPPAEVTMAPSPNAVTSTPSGSSPTPASTVPPVDRSEEHTS